MSDLIAFYNEMTGLIDEGTAVDTLYLDFSKVSDIVSHLMLIERLLMYSLG